MRLYKGQGQGEGGMLGINVIVEGDKVVIEGFNRLSHNITDKAVPRALSRIAQGTAVEALANLTGPKRGLKTVTSKKGRQRAVGQKGELAGGYPVPMLTGNLRRLLGFVMPGRTKSSNGKTFTAGPMEAIVFDSAEYAMTIHEGRGSSAKYGRRPFMDDAFKTFNAGARTKAIMEEEIAKEIKK